MTDRKKGALAIALLALASGLAWPEKAGSREFKCVTWDEAKPEIRRLYGRVGNPPIPDLPNGFNKGCVFYDSGASTIALYVLRDEFDPQSIGIDTEAERERDSIPRLNASNLSKPLDLIKSGDMLRFFNVCASVGTAQWCRGTPKNRAYVKDGLVCFRNMCVQANGVPHRELLKLWNATKNQWPDL